MARRGLRVIAGEAGGLRLRAPRGQRIRPTSDRVKESLFSALGDVEGAAVLDLYCGSGSLGIEALSRGSARAVLVDRAAPAVATARENLRTTGLADRARVVRGEVEAFVAAAPPAEAPFDLVFLDPPYDEPARAVGAVLRAIGRPAWASSGARLVLERAAGAAPVPAPVGWDAGWRRTIGGTLVHVLSRLAP
jgi:16S rRNA (guanine966-N2)-methyltransferase